MKRGFTKRWGLLALAGLAAALLTVHPSEAAARKEDTHKTKEAA